MKRVEVHIAEGETNRRLGTLEYDELRGKEISSFELDGDYILHPSVPFLGPDIGLFRGKQYPTLSYGFGIFQDAAPDSWGRKIIRRREKRGNLRESDYLLGVFDLTRLGALRFRLDGAEGFVNADGENPAPPCRNSGGAWCSRFSSQTRTTICATTVSYSNTADGVFRPHTISTRT